MYRVSLRVIDRKSNKIVHKLSNMPFDCPDMDSLNEAISKYVKMHGYSNSRKYMISNKHITNSNNIIKRFIIDMFYSHN